MNINFRRLSDSVVRRTRFVYSQMWTMAITHSHNVDLDDIYVNSTSASRLNTLNTDGCDTIYSDRITFRRWLVSNGDDAIALKPNSSNIAVYDSTFVNGQGIAIGSMGQYRGRFQCSAAAAGCDNVEVADVRVTKPDGQPLDNWHCENVHGSMGFRCNP